VYLYDFYDFIFRQRLILVVVQELCEAADVEALLLAISSGTGVVGDNAGCSEGINQPLSLQTLSVVVAETVGSGLVHLTTANISSEHTLTAVTCIINEGAVYVRITIDKTLLAS